MEDDSYLRKKKLNNPFLGGDEQNAFPEWMNMMSPQPEMGGDVIELSGRRSSSTTIILKKEVDLDPQRDAALMDIFLSSTLHPKSYEYLCNIIINRYLERVLANPSSKELIEKLFGGEAPQKELAVEPEQPPKKPRRKKNENTDGSSGV